MEQRSISKKYLNKNYEIAIFENDIVRLALKDRNLEKCEYQLLDEIVYLEIKQNEILWQIIRDGIKIDNKEYMFFTATTGQVRNTTVTLIRKDFFQKYKGFLMVGLTLEYINAKGGMNVGKYLAFDKNILNAAEKPNTIVTRNLKAVKRIVAEGYGYLLKRTCLDKYQKICFIFYGNNRIVEIKNEEDAISRAKYEEKHTTSRKEIADTQMSALIKKAMEEQ